MFEAHKSNFFVFENILLNETGPVQSPILALKKDAETLEIDGNTRYFRNRMVSERPQYSFIFHSFSTSVMNSCPSPKSPRSVARCSFFQTPGWSDLTNFGQVYREVLLADILLCRCGQLTSVSQARSSCLDRKRISAEMECMHTTHYIHISYDMLIIVGLWTQYIGSNIF